MRLTKVRITEFQSIQDSSEFEIGPVTCLVGKNEAGKTALLKALYRLHPISQTDGRYNATHDYPRQSLFSYEGDVEANRREPATVAQATYELEPEDVTIIENIFGPSCLVDDTPSVTLSRGYSNQLEISDVDVDCQAALGYLVKAADLPQQIAGKLGEQTSARDMLQLLSEAEQTEAVRSLRLILQRVAEDGLSRYILDEILMERIPKFLYFDEYHQMKGQDNLERLQQRVSAGALTESDHPLLGLIGLAGLKLEQIVHADETETLIARLEAAGSQLTQGVLRYWSQNRHIRMKFDIRAARPKDGPGMDSGTNIWGRVEDTKHLVTTPLGTRSKGFVWFFSFLAWYSKLRREGKNLILLLDEPGLSLHAKAQADLLSFFEEDLIPHHQLIYTTHSPFMVDPKHFDRVRIVQDLSVETDAEALPEEKQGTKVIKEVLEATPDSLFPLQSALGYEIHQTLFIGPNCLIIEGASDLLYIQVMSALLQKLRKSGLSSDWTLTPVGGASNVATFVALMGAQTTLNVAVLIDFQKKGRQAIENLYQSKLLKKKQVMTFADFTGSAEADIEDMFDPEFYVDIVNREFGSSLKLDDLSSGHPRVVYRLEEHLKKHPFPKDVQFNHYRPARYFNENVGSLESELSKATIDRFQQVFDSLNQLLQAGVSDPPVDTALRRIRAFRKREL